MNQAIDRTTSSLKYFFWKFISLASIAAIATTLINFWRNNFFVPKIAEEAPAQDIVPEKISGLTEAEADALRVEGRSNDVSFEPPRLLGDIVKENVFSIFNVSLLGVAAVQFILGMTLDALLSLGISISIIGLQVGQEIFVRKRLGEVVELSRLKATVIREGRARSIDPSEIVRGDALVIGPGDQFMVDGKLLTNAAIVVNESRVTGEDPQLTKKIGDPVYAGGYCISGRAAYLAEKVGEDRLIAQLVANTPPKKILTPLEKIVKQILTIMLTIVAIFFALGLVRYFQLENMLGVDLDAVVSATNVIFRLAPAGLYFMVFLNYVSGSAQLVRQGALTHRVRSVETLAHATDLVVTQGSTRSGLNVRLENIDSQDKEGKYTGSRLRQLLGDFGRSSSTSNQAVQTLEDIFPGEQRKVKFEAPLLSAYGWSAIAFNDDDVQGVFVIGEARILEPYLEEQKSVELVSEEIESNDNKSSLFSSVRTGFSSFGRFFRRSDKTNAENSDLVLNEASGERGYKISEELASSKPGSVQTAEKPRAPLRNFIKRIGKNFSQDEDEAKELGDSAGENPDDKAMDEYGEQVVYLFAYHPDISSLHDESGIPQLPENLRPLCRLHYSKKIHPEAIEAMRKIEDTDVKLRVFSHGPPGGIIDALKKAGQSGKKNGLKKEIKGSDLSLLEGNDLRKAVRENIVFGNVTADQVSKAVKILRDDKRTVTVIGGDPSDLPGMQAADLSIAAYGSSQAAISVADIILLNDEPGILVKILKEGQKIVNGLLDVLRLYLTQMVYLVLLIVSLLITGNGFPFLDKQVSLIAIGTLTIPSLFFSLTALPGAPPNVDQLSSTLKWFIGPAALNISIAGAFLFVYFLESTGDKSYAQLALTQMLLISGMALSVLMRPPTVKKNSRKTNNLENKDGGGPSRDWRATIMFIVLVTLLFIIAPMRWTKELFEFDRLMQSLDYFIVWIAVFAWIIVVEIFWHTLTPKPYRPH